MFLLSYVVNVDTRLYGCVFTLLVNKRKQNTGNLHINVFYEHAASFVFSFYSCNEAHDACVSDI